MHLRPETASDHAAIRAVNDAAFGQDAEGRLVDALRAGGFARLSLVAEDEGRVVAHVLFSELPIHTPGGVVRALALAPMAVEPGRQRRGIGSALVRDGLRRCRELGERIVVVLGHVEYYPRFGFSARAAEPLACAYAGPAFMALELVPGALRGVAGEVRYPAPFRAV